MTTATANGLSLRVLVVDDHDVVHWGFRLMLTQQPWVERCLSARNADHHADAARVTVRASCSEDTFILEVANDRIRPRGGTSSTGMGLRLAAFEALNAGGFVEFGEHEGIWKVRLVVPIDDDG